jgi:hypothetical protein
VTWNYAVKPGHDDAHASSALAAGAEPAHEAMADQRGIAHGRPGAGRNVDLGREQIHLLREKSLQARQ